MGPGVCCLSCGEVRITLRELRSKYPEARKYLIALYFLMNGCGSSFLLVMTQTFMPVSLRAILTLTLTPP